MPNDLQAPTTLPAITVYYAYCMATDLMERAHTCHDREFTGELADELFRALQEAGWGMCPPVSRVERDAANRWAVEELGTEQLR